MNEQSVSKSKQPTKQCVRLRWHCCAGTAAPRCCAGVALGTNDAALFDVEPAARRRLRMARQRGGNTQAEAERARVEKLERAKRAADLTCCATE